MLPSEINSNLNAGANAIAGKKFVDEEEFFERALFQDVLEMKSVRMVSETATIEFEKLQDQVYHALFNLYQKARGIKVNETSEKDEVFGVFELFFKCYYQHFRTAMEGLISNSNSPVKIAYILGKKSDQMIAALDAVVKEIEKELH